MESETMKKSSLFLLIIVVAFALVLAACSSATAQPTPVSGNATSGSGSTTLDGKSILEAKCQSCHSLAPVYNTQQNQDGWTRIVDNMIQRGANLTADERTTLNEYLAATYK